MGRKRFGKGMGERGLLEQDSIRQEGFHRGCCSAVGTSASKGDGACRCYCMLRAPLRACFTCNATATAHTRTLGPPLNIATDLLRLYCKAPLLCLGERRDDHRPALPDVGGAATTRLILEGSSCAAVKKHFTLNGREDEGRREVARWRGGRVAAKERGDVSASHSDSNRH